YERIICQEHAAKTRLLGNPRASVAAQARFDERYFRSLGLDPARPTIMVVMGSLGSSSVNEMMKDALRAVDPRYQILYVSGRNNPMDPAVFADRPDIHVVDYVEQLAVLPHIDLIICRAGATTLAEITALGVAAILVPSPYVAHNHQFYNASVLVDARAALMIEEKDLSADTLKQAVSAVMDDPIRLEEMKAHARSLGKPHACADILDWCEELKGGIKK
ncbi:MAG: glycosyltransferase, partial [Merdibacter sp.]|nr:glycosyltransferase [Merdibacter sp.]